MGAQELERPKRPTRPESRFVIQGVSFWPFDNRPMEGPWSERANAYGSTPAWAKRLLTVIRPKRAGHN